MKKIVFLIAVLSISTLLSGQHIRADDTVVVFKLNIKTQNGMVIKYVAYNTGKELRWTDKQNRVYKSVLRGINARYLLLDTTRVLTSQINAIIMTHLPVTSGYASLKTRPVIFDSSGLFNIMSYYDFRILSEKDSYSNITRAPNPFFKNITSEQYAAALDNKKKRRTEHFAALDTCPLHYGIKTNLVKDLINEINLSIEIPVNRNFCIDVGGGILYTGSNANTLGYDEAFAQFKWFKSSNQFWFDHSYYNRKGFGLEVIPKFFFSRKKVLYAGPQLSFHYYNYQDKWVFNFDEGSDDYHRDHYAYQSEKSESLQVNAMFGVQTPQIKKFLFDAFVSFGFMYRGGSVSRSIEKTVYHYYGTHIDNYDPALTFKGGGFSLSAQIGLRLGFRFGKAHLCTKKMQKNKGLN